MVLCNKGFISAWDLVLVLDFVFVISFGNGGE